MSTDPVAELFRRLHEEPFSFSWFQAVRRLECAAPHRPRVGTSHRVADDLVRFCQDPTLAFAASTVAGLDDGDGGNRARRMTVNFLGMLGPNGPMPLHLTEYARDRMLHGGDQTLVRFLDVFHHRMLSLFYRAWASNQQTVSYDRSAATPPEDRFAVYVASTIGRGMPAMQNRDAVADASKLFYAGRLAGATAHAEGLAAVLSDYFGVPCAIEPFVGQWLDLPVENRCLLGRTPDTATLGRSGIVGSKIWDVQSKFRIRLGPMDFEKFSSLLPGHAGNEQLRAWVKNYVGESLDWEARVVLARQRVPKIRLGEIGHLGRSTWLHASAVPADVDDFLLGS